MAFIFPSSYETKWRRGYLLIPIEAAHDNEMIAPTGTE
jgi:hypothetical protein